MGDDISVFCDVKIKALGVKAKVLEKSKRYLPEGSLMEYKVVYWFDGERRDHWVFEHEIEGV